MKVKSVCTESTVPNERKLPICSELSFPLYEPLSLISHKRLVSIVNVLKVECSLQFYLRQRVLFSSRRKSFSDFGSYTFAIRCFIRRNNEVFKVFVCGLCSVFFMWRCDIFLGTCLGFLSVSRQKYPQAVVMTFRAYFDARAEVFRSKFEI